jgi:hypothetical protein
MADDGDPVRDRPSGGLSLWRPRSGWPLAFWLLAGLMVAVLVAARLFLEFAGAVAGLIPFGSCGCGEPSLPPPEHPWYQSSGVRIAALAWAPLLVMGLYLVVGTIYVRLARRPIVKCILLTGAVVAGGLALQWVLLGGITDLLVQDPP